MDLNKSWFVHSVWTFTHRQFSVMCCMASDDSWTLALSFQYIGIPQVWILQYFSKCSFGYIQVC